MSIEQALALHKAKEQEIERLKLEAGKEIKALLAPLIKEIFKKKWLFESWKFL